MVNVKSVFLPQKVDTMNKNKIEKISGQIESGYKKRSWVKNCERLWLI